MSLIEIFPGSLKSERRWIPELTKTQSKSGWEVVTLATQTETSSVCKRPTLGLVSRWNEVPIYETWDFIQPADIELERRGLVRALLLDKGIQVFLSTTDCDHKATISDKACGQSATNTWKSPLIMNFLLLYIISNIPIKECLCVVV